MPVYSYKGYDIMTGASKKGRIESDSAKNAKVKLKRVEKIIVSELKEEQSTNKDKAEAPSFLDRFIQPKVKLMDLSIMTRQFATLLNAHVPIDESLRALSRQVDSPLLRNILSEVKDQISEGKSLADALGSFPQTFTRLYVNMVRAGETSGSLGLVLTRLADYQEHQIKTRGQVLTAMTYPAIMILASGGIIIYLFVSVVPKLTKIFDSLKVTLPWYTKLLIGLSNFMQNYWYLIILMLGAMYYIFDRWVKTTAGKSKFDRILLNLPLFGGLFLRMSVSSFTKTLSTLLDSGVTIINAMDITKNIIPNTVIAAVVEKAKIAVQEGENLGVVIERSGEFPPLVSHMIMTGEKTGQLEEMLGHVSVAYDAEVERKITSLIAMIEPIMIVAMGGVTTLVVMAMLLPMFQVMGQVR